MPKLNRNNQKEYISSLARDPNLLKKKYQRSKNSLSLRYRTYKRHAKNKKLEFEITKEKFDEITKQPCFYCGGFTKNKKINGIDRINSKKGYVKGNLRPCCWMCNMGKGAHSTQSYLAHCKKVVNHQKNKQH